MRWLDLQRPDVVYLSGVSADVWRPLVGQASQPMSCTALTPHAEPAPFTPFPDNLITCRPVLGLLHREAAIRRRPAFLHVLATEGHRLAPYAEAVFGHLDANWVGVAGPPNREPPVWLKAEQTTIAYIEACARAADPAFWSWLDVGSDGVGAELSLAGPVPPTVVVATADDLALYWNLRSGRTSMAYPGSCRSRQRMRPILPCTCRSGLGSGGNTPERQAAQRLPGDLPLG